MHVQMGHGIPRILSHVEDQPISTLIDTFEPNHFLSQEHYRCQIVAMVSRDFSCVGNMAFWHHEDMRGSRWVQITERKRPIRFNDPGRRNLPSHDLAKQTIRINVAHAAPR